MRRVLRHLLVLVLAAAPVGAEASTIEGLWFIDDKPCFIKMISPTTAMFTNEFGKSSKGTVEPGFVNAWGMKRNSISEAGASLTINWANGTRWIKTSIGGGYVIFIDGRPLGCQVLEVGLGKYTFMNEHGQKATARLVNPYKLRVDEWNVDCTVVFSGKCVELTFSNGSSWLSPWAK